MYLSTRRDLPLIEKWQIELLTFIRQSDAVVFIISPAFVESTWCRWETERVAELNKRLAPVVLERVPDVKVPAALREVTFAFFDNSTDFDIGADRLSAALNTNIESIKAHTRIAERARLWAEAGRPEESRLFRGAELREAENMVSVQNLEKPRCQLHCSRSSFKRAEQQTSRRSNPSAAKLNEQASYNGGLV